MAETKTIKVDPIIITDRKQPVTYLHNLAIRLDWPDGIDVDTAAIGLVQSIISSPFNRPTAGMYTIELPRLISVYHDAPEDNKGIHATSTNDREAFPPGKYHGMLTVQFSNTNARLTPYGLQFVGETPKDMGTMSVEMVNMRLVAPLPPPPLSYLQRITSVLEHEVRDTPLWQLVRGAKAYLRQMKNDFNTL